MGKLIPEQFLSTVFSMPTLTGITVDVGTIIAVLYGIVAVMVIVVLYHALFIMVDLRKITRRFEDMTSQVETVLLKPLSIADQAIQWLTEFIDRKRDAHKRSARHAVPDADDETEE
jgi:uncharacterized membrane protein YccC